MEGCATYLFEPFEGQKYSFWREIIRALFRAPSQTAVLRRLADEAFGEGTLRRLADMALDETLT